MLPISKKMSVLLSLCLLPTLFTPALTRADTALLLAQAETGSVAARQAREQREALAKKAEERAAKKAAEAKAAANKDAASETEAPAEAQTGQ